MHARAEENGGVGPSPEQTITEARGPRQCTALAGTRFRLAGCGSTFSAWHWGSEERDFSGFSRWPNGMEVGASRLFVLTSDIK